MALRDAMDEFRRRISAIQSDGFEFAARLSLIAGLEDRDKELAALQTIHARFEEAKQLLSRGLEVSFQNMDKPFPAALKDSASAAHRSVSTLLNELTKAMKQAEAQSDLDATCRQILDFQVEEVAPAVLDVMTELDAAIATSEDEAGRDNKTLITSAVSEIDDINSVINLISVNASVEAARAGPAGRGFAVIASEIQSLSHRSQQAVSNIRSQLR